jgi:hypothetical protein
MDLLSQILDNLETILQFPFPGVAKKVSGWK